MTIKKDASFEDLDDVLEVLDGRIEDASMLVDPSINDRDGKFEGDSIRMESTNDMVGTFAEGVPICKDLELMDREKREQSAAKSDDNAEGLPICKDLELMDREKRE
jgi:hypothetical protein